MWVEIERIRARIPNLLPEVSLRVLIILIVCIMQTKVKPYVHHITESEFLNYMRPRRDSYVPPWATVVIIVFVPLLFFCLPYLLTKNYEDTVQCLLAWTLALAINAFITESTKLMVGRPRPDFYYRCFPTGERTFHFTGNMRDVMEGRKSFPSGHSSFAFCSMGFLSMWLCGRLKVMTWNRGEVLRIVACLLPLVLASIVAISRFCDNHHHWDDILVGSMIGFSSSYFCYCQYYNPLHSALAGFPYLVTARESFVASNVQDSNYNIDEVCYTTEHYREEDIKENEKYT